MRTVHALDPDGVLWDVRVVWLPRHAFLSRRVGGWRRRKDGRDNGLTDTLDAASNAGSFDDPVGAFAALVFLLVGAALFWWVLLPLLLVVLDLLLVALLLLLGSFARVFLRRPWRVEAVDRGSGRVRARHEVAVVGWRRALRARDGVAQALRRSGPAAWPTLAARSWD